MAELTDEERKKIYAEEKARTEAKEKLKKEAVAKKNKHAGIGCLAIIIIAGLIWISGLFKGKKAPEPSTLTLQASVMQIFGSPKGQDDSGVIKVIPGEKDCAIHYRFFPLGMFGFEKELGSDLAPKIKTFYQKDGRAENLTFLVLGPFDDAYGNRKWNPVVSFEFTREIYNRINWQNFLNSDLLSITDNIIWMRKVQ